MIHDSHFISIAIFPHISPESLSWFSLEFEN